MANLKNLEEKNNKLDDELKLKNKLIKKYEEEKNTLRNSKEMVNNDKNININTNSSNDNLLLSKYVRIKKNKRRIFRDEKKL